MATTAMLLPRSICSWIVPRRRLMSPMTSPRWSPGVTVSTFMTGSSRIGPVFLLDLQALFHRRYEFARHGAAHRLVFEYEAAAALERLEDDPDFRELTGAARLLL